MRVAALALAVWSVVSSAHLRAEQGSDADGLDTGAFSRLQRIEEETVQAAEADDDAVDGPRSPGGEGEEPRADEHEARDADDDATDGDAIAGVDDEPLAEGRRTDGSSGEHEDEADRPPPPGGGERRGAGAPRDDGEDDGP